jgi:hypothetical protein
MAALLSGQISDALKYYKISLLKRGYPLIGSLFHYRRNGVSEADLNPNG